MLVKRPVCVLRPQLGQRRVGLAHAAWGEALIEGVEHVDRLRGLVGQVAASFDVVARASGDDQDGPALLKAHLLSRLSPFGHDRDGLDLVGPVAGQPGPVCCGTVGRRHGNRGRHGRSPGGRGRRLGSRSGVRLLTGQHLVAPLPNPDNQEGQRHQADRDRGVDEGQLRPDDADQQQDERDEDECPADDDHVGWVLRQTGRRAVGAYRRGGGPTCARRRPGAWLPSAGRTARPPEIGRS